MILAQLIWRILFKCRKINTYLTTRIFAGNPAATFQFEIALAYKPVETTVMFSTLFSFCAKPLLLKYIYLDGYLLSVRLQSHLTIFLFILFVISVLHFLHCRKYTVPDR